MNIETQTQWFLEENLSEKNKILIGIFEELKTANYLKEKELELLENFTNNYEVSSEY